MEGRSFRDLIAWQRAMDLVYRVTRGWPSGRGVRPTGQVRRAAISVTANIAEGQGRSGPREFLHHLSIAHGSLAEVESLLLVSHRQGYVDTPDLDRLFVVLDETRRLLRGLIRSLRPPTTS